MSITIPPAALEAGARAYRTQHYTVTHEDAIRAACLDMLEAWPGAYIANEATTERPPVLCLPLPTEASDAKR